jgi:Na+-transporting NADH:ubiquinone oxidoreductase subunit C
VHSNKYTFLFAIVISVVTAVLLAFAAQGLKPFQDANIKLDIKTSILRSVRETATDRDTIEKIYAATVEELVITTDGQEIKDAKANSIILKKEFEKPEKDRHLALYIYTNAEGKKHYVIPMQGAGLWGPIYGYISIENDFNTVYGAYFSHKSETPGLGAEIAEAPFQNQFQGKKIMGDDQNFVSVHVVKKTAKVSYGPEHRVDGISGGTITSNGTDQMLKKCIAPYLPYFEKIKNES